MINFHKVNNHLYRGGSLTPKDVLRLKRHGFTKIVSLDADVANKIDRATKLLGVEHIKLPIDINNKMSLINFLNYDIEDLLGGKRVFVGCIRGKDRTGLAIAMYRCEHDGWSCEKAIKEAKKLGFGIGVNPKVIRLYIKLINKACGCNEEDMHDVNSAYDIVSNEREYPSDYADYTLDSWEQGSWSPYLDYRVESWPYSPQYIDWPEQYQSRQDYGLDDRVEDSSVDYGHGFPQPGQWNTSTQGIMGSGPSLVGSGYI
jgi:hypothetical protein